MKNNKFRILYLSILLLLPRLSHAQNGVGSPVLFNDGWSFHKGDVNSGSTGGSPDVQWKPVEIPHDWSIEGPFSDEWASATGYLPGGIGWYKKTFTADKTWQAKQVYIYFDGVYKNSEVWINGHYLGKRPNGFIPFQYEISPYLNYTGKNTIAVKADHSEFADSRWYTGSGIYRNVYLVVKNKVHIGLWGVAFSTPAVSVEKSSVKVDVNISNDKTVPANVSIAMKLVDSNGKVVAAANKPLSAKKGNNEISFSSDVNNPQLWDLNRPYLYRLQVSVTSNGKVIDEQSQQVGIRDIRFDTNDGFFLNGKVTKIKGVCIHDDAGALGVAVPVEVWVRRLQILKEAGVNSVRLSHNPHADYLYDLCDKMGLLVMDEAFDEWEVGKNKWVKGWNVGTPSKDGYHEYFKEWANRDLGDMILRDRNHPSIIMWSIGNEIDYPNDPYTNPVLNSGINPQIYGKGYLPDHPAADSLTVIAKQLVKTVKAIDQTRPVTAALAGVVMSNEVGYPETLDIVGYNYQEYRYAGDHKKYPNRVIYGSENGMKKQAWEAVDTNAYISAQFLWTGIDYMGEAGKWPQRGNGAGLMDLAGFKKPEFYNRQSLWSDKPMVYLTARKISATDTNRRGRREMAPMWNWPDASKLSVECYTNCQEAELFLNGRSLGKIKKATAKNQTPSWDVDYQAGELLVKGYNNGAEVSSYTINTSGNAAKINAVADQTLIKGRIKGLSQVEIQITDDKGNPVYAAANELEVTVAGPAKLLGLESGDLASHEDYQASKRTALHGRLLAYIQTTGKPGAVSVKITATDLKPATINLTVQ